LFDRVRGGKEAVRKVEGLKDLGIIGESTPPTTGELCCVTSQARERALKK